MNWPEGLKRTPARQAVAEVFKAHREPLSVPRLSELLPDIHPTTLYRIVEAFLDHDLLIMADEFQPKEKRYLLKSESHRHSLRCIRCGKIFFLKHCPIHLPQNLEGFAVIHHRLEIEGICPACQKAQKGNLL